MNSSLPSGIQSGCVTAFMRATFASLGLGGHSASSARRLAPPVLTALRCFGYCIDAFPHARPLPRDGGVLAHFCVLVRSTFKRCELCQSRQTAILAVSA